VTSLEENKRLVRLYFEAPTSGNLDVLDEIMSDDFTVHAIHGKYSTVINASDDERGPAAFKQWALAWRATWHGIHVSVDEIVAEGDRVIALWTFSGVHVGDFFGIAATHKRVTYSGFNIFRIADGKLAESWDMLDRLSQWQQLGVLPETAEFLAQARAQRASP